MKRRMRKRRRSTKPSFDVVAWIIAIVLWVVVSMILAGFISLLLESHAQEEVVSACVTEVEAPKDYILDIPLSCELQEELHNACVEFGVDYYIMVALIDRETHFRNVQGDNGNSYGYCQIQPRWWYGLMCEIGATDLNVPKDNFRTACAIMSGLTKTYNSTEGALVAYNQGSYKGKSTSYSREIIANAERYRA